MSRHVPARLQPAARAAQERTPATQPSLIERPPLSWLVAFAKFWYGFIFGDDWTMAVAVAVGLTVTALLVGRGISVWWLVPAIVIVMVGFDLERASRRQRK